MLGRCAPACSICPTCRTVRIWNRGFMSFNPSSKWKGATRSRSFPAGWCSPLFDSRGRMGLLEDAVRLAESNGGAVDIAAVRRYRSRAGIDINVEQQMTDDLGLFARIGRAGGNVEAYEFTDIDRTVSAGLSWQGTRWRRPADTLGLAAIGNGISGTRQRYLNAGGLGILVGDGRLPHPGPEKIIETFYSLAVFSAAHLSFDYQWINHPAYNRDRGPVSVVALRLHAQF